MGKRHVVWSSIIIFLYLISPIYGKTEGFKEVSKKKYDADIWHTYEHTASGLEVIWIENDDTNKAFVIGVKTPTTNDTGVNHIIEHTVFTGSKKYPSSSVFFDAGEAYPSTYMNALTSGDMTIFPFSTPYLPCYNKLREIYLDAVFNPSLVEQPYGFYEEGFHSVPQEGRCGGVVYNEMKGAYSSVERAVYRAIRQKIYTGSHYAYDSGGSPNAIPTLTYEEFVETYKRYYYPGNMRIIVYGNIPIQETLNSILPYVQGKEKQQSIDLSVEKINSDKFINCEILPNQDKGGIVKAFVLKDDVTATELQKLDLWMSTYLMSPQSYFQGSLSALGLQAKWLKDDDVPYPVYSIVITDIPKEKIESCSKILDRLFEEAPKYINKNVFQERDILKEAKWLLEKQESSNNRGINVAQSILDGWAHHREENQYYLMKTELESMEELDTTISDLLIHQATRNTLNLLPGEYQLEDPQNQSTISEEKWCEIYKEIQEWQKQKISLEQIDLNELVLAPNNIPDIKKKVNYWEMETKADTDLACSTLYVNTSHIAQEDLPYLYLYSYLLEESAKDITPFSGMISTQCTAYPLKEGYWPCFKFSIVTNLEEKQHGVLFEQARMYLKNRSEKWYQQKLIEFTLGMKGASQNNALATLAQLAIGRENDRGAYLYQQSYPLYKICQGLLQTKQNIWIEHIKKIDCDLYHTGGTILATTLPKKKTNEYAMSWNKILEKLPKQPNLKADYEFEIPDGTCIVENEAEVDYCYMNLYKQEGIEGSDYLLAAYLTKHYLNPQIRVRMGAYGAGCQIYDLQTVGIYTYRDPDYRSSLPIINASPQWLKEMISEEELSLSKAEALSKVHSQYKLLSTPIEQSATMEHMILWGRSPKEIIGLERDIILSTPASMRAKQNNYEKIIRAAKIAIMTKKDYKGEQNFTIYRY